MSATEARDRATELAKTDSRAALKAAREIEDPWFRAQALATVGRYAPQPELKAVLKEAKTASLDADEPYKVVASSAWWLRAMIERGDLAGAALEVESLVARSSEISHPVSRLDALFLLFQAAFDLDASRRLVLAGLISACGAANSWRAGDSLRDAPLMLIPSHPEEAQHVIASMPEGKYKRTAIQRLAAGQKRTPRIFFW